MIKYENPTSYYYHWHAGSRPQRPHDVGPTSYIQQVLFAYYTLEI